MKSKLDKFLRYLQVERGVPQGTIEAYQLDIEKGLIPFLHRRGKSEIAEVTKDDIRAYLDYLVVNRGKSSVTRARKLAAIKSFFNYLVETKELKASREGTRKQLTRLKEKGYVEGDSQEGWLITDAGRKALEAGAAQPSMTDQADIRDDLRRVWVNS